MYLKNGLGVDLENVLEDVRNKKEEPPIGGAPFGGDATDRLNDALGFTQKLIPGFKGNVWENLYNKQVGANKARKVKRFRGVTDAPWQARMVEVKVPQNKKTGDSFPIVISIEEEDGGFSDKKKEKFDFQVPEGVSSGDDIQIASTDGGVTWDLVSDDEGVTWKRMFISI